MRETYGINEADFLTFDAIRQAAQCAGRVIRGKNDYGLVIFADARYNKQDKRSKLPAWIQQFMSDSYSNLSTDIAMASARQFLRQMAQPLGASHHTVSLSEVELVNSAGYVSRVSTAGIDQRQAMVAPAMAVLAGVVEGPDVDGVTAQPMAIG